MNDAPGQQRSTLEGIARRAMQARGFITDYSPAAQAKLKELVASPPAAGTSLKDLRNLPWASIDNDDSMDLDQLTVAQNLPDGTVAILVAIADVDGMVQKGSPIDADANHNTTSVYTQAKIFAMLPPQLSTDLTSLSDQKDRPAIVIEIRFKPDGTPAGSDVYTALVRNRAKLAYNATGAWLEGRGPAPAPIGAVTGLADNLKLQDQVAQKIRALRHLVGALDLQTQEGQAVFADGAVSDVACGWAL